MKVLLRSVSVVMWAIAAFLIYAVIHAVTSAGGARVGVAIGCRRSDRPHRRRRVVVARPRGQKQRPRAGCLVGATEGSQG